MSVLIEDESSDYDQFLISIANALTADDENRIKRTLRDDDIDSEALQSRIDCIRYLGKRGLQELFVTLTEIGCCKLARKVKIQIKYDKKVKACPYCGRNVVDYYYETKDASNLRQLLDREEVAVITGISGSGKSQLAYWFADEFSRTQTNSFVWKFDCSSKALLVKSMSTLLYFLDIPVDSFVNFTPPRLTEALDGILQKLAKSCLIGLFIFDDVTETCSGLAKQFVQHCKRMKTKGVNVPKIIVTTNDAMFDCLEGSIKMEGMSEAEVKDFFKQEGYDIKMPELENLRSKLGLLPLGLISARSYITQCKISIDSYLKLLDNEKFRKKEDHMVHEVSDYDKSLLAAITVALTKLKRNLSDEAFSILPYIPFLEHGNVSVVLLKSILPTTMSKKARDVILCKFVEGLKRYSLGAVYGEDDERSVSFHDVTRYAISIYFDSSTKENKYSRMKTLLLILLSHIDIGVRRYSKLQVNQLFLTHAMKILEDMSREDYFDKQEVMVASSYLHCAIGATYRLEGVDDWTANEHQRKALNIIAKLSKIQLDLVELCSKTNDIVQVQQRAAEVYETLTKSKVDETFIRDFLYGKSRIRKDIQYFCDRGELQECDFPNNQANDFVHRHLVQRKLATPIERLSQYFVLEIFLYIIYNMCRNFYRLEKLSQEDKIASSENMDTPDVLKLFKFCKALGDLLEKEDDSFPIYQMTIVRRNFLLYTGLRNKPCDKETARKSIGEYVKMSEDVKDYFGFGMVIMGINYNDYHKSVCFKYALKCYTFLLEQETDTTEKENIYQQGKRYINELKNSVQSLEDFQASSSFYIQMAKFLKQDPNSCNGSSLTDALEFLEKAEKIEIGSKANIRSHFMRQIRISQIECYSKLPDHKQKCEDMCMTFLQDLEGTKNDKHRKRAIEVLNLISSRE